jgi:hypothetical protein
MKTIAFNETECIEIWLYPIKSGCYIIDYAKCTGLNRQDLRIVTSDNNKIENWTFLI